MTIDEYKRLVEVAYREGNERLALIIQTLNSTGIRVGELKCITVENILKEMINVRNKGKCRVIILPCKLQRMLGEYACKMDIISGPVFCTETGKNIDRSYIWRQLKQTCLEAKVSAQKVYLI